MAQAAGRPVRLSDLVDTVRVDSDGVLARHRRGRASRTSKQHVSNAETGWRNASAAVRFSQLRVVHLCELCDADHRQARYYTPWLVVGLYMGAYEDNFGFWDVDGLEERAFFQHVQGKSVLRACERCKRPVRLIPIKTVCASCVAALECGAPASMNEYGYSQKALLDPSHPPGWSLHS